MLVLRAQSILFDRYGDVLQPYKYTGYPMLIKTIKLNAEELRREHGMEALETAFERCVSVVDRSVDRQEQDRLVLFISKLILHKENVVDVLKASGLKTLVELITLAHLQTSRAVIPTQTQAIEKGNEKDRNGPVGFSELKDVFAEGNITRKTTKQGLGSGHGGLAAAAPGIDTHDYYHHQSVISLSSPGASAQVDPGGPGHGSYE